MEYNQGYTSPKIIKKEKEKEKKRKKRKRKNVKQQDNIKYE